MLTWPKITTFYILLKGGQLGTVNLIEGEKKQGLICYVCLICVGVWVRLSLAISLSGTPLWRSEASGRLVVSPSTTTLIPCGLKDVLPAHAYRTILF